jgi:hypothetical protein
VQAATPSLASRGAPTTRATIPLEQAELSYLSGEAISCLGSTRLIETGTQSRRQTPAFNVPEL